MNHVASLEELKNIQFLGLSIWVVSPNRQETIFMETFTVEKTGVTGAFIALNDGRGQCIASTFGINTGFDEHRIFSDKESADAYNQKLTAKRRAEFVKSQGSLLRRNR